MARGEGEIESKAGNRRERARLRQEGGGNQGKRKWTLGRGGKNTPQNKVNPLGFLLFIV